MYKEELKEKIQEIVARECSMYTDTPIGKDRFVSAAMQILWLLENHEK